jgi:micrococcal nuclease
MRALALLALAGLVVGAFLWIRHDHQSLQSAVVARVIDGDTIVLASGDRVRLVQIDTPEKHKECYGDDASAVTRRLLPPGTQVRIEADPRLDQIDRYNRRLAYVWKGGEDVNLRLVREGAAGVWFFSGKRGRYASALLAAGEQARQKRRGLWGACPLARFDPLDSMSSGPSS